MWGNKDIFSQLIFKLRLCI